MFAPILMVQLAWLHQYISETVLVAPIGKETLTSCKFLDFTDFYSLTLQHHYTGARQLEAPIFWCISKRIKMFAAPRLFG
jgi:hypothetical protein